MQGIRFRVEEADAKAGSAVKLLGLLAPTPSEVEGLLQKG